MNHFASKPNILLILSDDHGYADLSFKASVEDVDTPNLDRLRQSGMLLEQGYVSAPICSPSRAGLMVGAYQQRWGAEWFGNSQFAPEPFIAIPQVLKRAGYQTGYFGKVHYGPDQVGSRACPENHGFDQSLYGLAAHGMGRLHYMIHDQSYHESNPDQSARLGMGPLYRNGQAEDCHDHLTRVFAREAIDFMTQAVKDQDTFFCMTAFNAVHNFTWQLPEDVLKAFGLPAHQDFDPAIHDYYDWYDGAILPRLENGRAYYLAQLSLMDQAIGQMLDTIDQLGIKDNTLIIYLTDNGGSPCNFADNRPLMGTKYSLYEGGIRVPFIASWPGVIEANSQSNNLVSSLDLLPTFAHLAGQDLPKTSPVDGLNLMDTFEGKNGGHDNLHFDTGFQWAVRTPLWKLLSREDDHQEMMRQRLLSNEHTDIGHGTALYAIDQDPSETTNLLDDHTQVYDELRQVRQKWVQDVKNSHVQDRR